MNKKDEACTLLCYLCNRPKDNYGHTHIDVEGREPLAICLSCMTGLANKVAHRIEAYMAGGILFDEYLIDRVRLGKPTAHGHTPMPDFMKDVLEQIRKKLHEQSDDSGNSGNSSNSGNSTNN